MKDLICAIIVTHNNEKHIDKCLDHLFEQTTPVEKIIVVDSGSSDTSYLEKYLSNQQIELIFLKENVGFCVANNVAYQTAALRFKYVTLVNPDLFLEKTALEQAVAFMENCENSKVAIVSGTLLGYDMTENKPTGKYDSTGVYSTWYGKWYDRHQGELVKTLPLNKIEQPEALCGALLFCRTKALEEVLIDKKYLLDPSFFMYKDDIDLSLRVRKARWRLIFLPSIKAYHCRGWQQDRSKVCRRFRLSSARNEVKIYFRERSPKVIYSLLKLAAVKYLDY